MKYLITKKKLLKSQLIIFYSLLLFTTFFFQPLASQPAWAVTCPVNTSDLGSTVLCANNCSDTCIGTDSRCCPDAANNKPNTRTNSKNNIRVGEPITQETLDALNPLVQQSTLADELSTPGGILSRFLTLYAFPLAGLILFVMLVWGGFEMMSGAANKKSIDVGKQRIKASLTGFLLLFAAYWIAQILEVIFGIQIL